jgi:hypothetical protein
MSDHDGQASRGRCWEWLPVDVFEKDRSENGLVWLMGLGHLRFSLRPDEHRRVPGQRGEAVEEARGWPNAFSL